MPEDEKSARLARLQAVLSGQMTDFNRNCIGRIVPVLVEKPGRMPGQMIGRSPYLQGVHFDDPQQRVGSIIQCKIDGITTNSLSATTVE